MPKLLPYETRVMSDGVDLRFQPEDGRPGRLTGYVVKFNTRSADLGGFVEVVAPGAFANALKVNDVRALIDHNISMLLGRTRIGTLQLVEDKIGLRFDVSLPDTSYARDLAVSVDRGDIGGTSFGFRPYPNGDKFSIDGPLIVRTLMDVNLKEITITSIPAYPDTSVQLRVDPDVLAHVQTLAPRPAATAAAALLRRLRV